MCHACHVPSLCVGLNFFVYVAEDVVLVLLLVVVVVGFWCWWGSVSCIIIKRRKLMKNGMGSFFGFLFTELKLPLIHTQSLTYTPLSHTGNTKFVFVVLESRLAA